MTRTTAKVPKKLPNPEDIREERDRSLALAFVRAGEGKGVAAQVIRDHGLLDNEVDRRKGYRGINRRLAWARLEVARERADSDAGTAPGAEAPDQHPNSTSGKASK